MKPQGITDEARGAAVKALSLGGDEYTDAKTASVARAILAAEAREREACAQVGRAAVMKFKSRVGGRYYAGYHEDMRDHVAQAIRTRTNAPTISGERE
jgi:hypothetical protein